jgi:hypothetical protein
MDDVTEKGVGIRTMPGDFEAKQTPGIESEHVPKLDRVDFIQVWRSNPLVPILADDDPRKRNVGRLDLLAHYREQQRRASEPQTDSGRSEWTAVTEVDGEGDTHGEFMKLRPGVNPVFLSFIFYAEWE